MARNYRHIQQYEKEILELREKGLPKSEIGEELGFTKEQIHHFITRYNRKKRKLAAGMRSERKADHRKIM